MLFSLIYLALRGVLRLLAPSDKLDSSTEVELLVLRHQLRVLRRQIGRPAYRRETA
jgi:hypothetical protein